MVPGETSEPSGRTKRASASCPTTRPVWSEMTGSNSE